MSPSDDDIDLPIAPDNVVLYYDPTDYVCIRDSKGWWQTGYYNGVKYKRESAFVIGEQAGE